MTQPYRERGMDPGFFYSLLNQGVSEETAHKIARDVRNLDVFEAVASRELTPEQGAEVLMLKREAERAAEPWLVRLLRWVFE